MNRRWHVTIVRMMKFKIVFARRCVCALSLIIIWTAAIRLVAAADRPRPPAEAPRHMTLPEGFRVTLFAGEPDVAQPIGFTTDDRGRLWVGECYSYPNWAAAGHDRLLVFTDQQNSGHFSERAVFSEKLANLTGLELGFGGVWLCCPPRLVFIPSNGDSATGEPQTMLDGWSLKGRHNILSGLGWGPDGW